MADGSKGLERFPSKPLVLALGLALGILPFAVYLYYVLRYSTNVPIADDYDAVLGFLHSFFQAGSPGEKLSLLFEQHNEHRIVFDRIVFLVQYLILGRVDFWQLTLFGNLGWIATVIVSVVIAKRDLHLSPLALLPIPYLLLAFAHVENMYFAMASIQNYWAVLFSMLFLVCLVRPKRFFYAVALFPIALYTSGGGAVLYILGNLYLFMVKRWKPLSVFFLSGTLFTAAYFIDYTKPAQHPSIVASLTNIQQTVLYFFGFLGSFMLAREVAVPIGLLIFLLLLYFGSRQTSIDVAVLGIGFILLTSILTALTRSGFGVDQALESRYTVYSLLACLFLYLLIVVHAGNSELTRRAVLLALTLSILYFLGLQLKYQLGGYLEWQKAERINSVAAFVAGDESRLFYPDKAKAARILSLAEEQGTYDYKGVTTYQVPSQFSDSGYESKDIKWTLEHCDRSLIAGWAFIPGVSAEGSSIMVILANGDKSFQLKSLNVIRPDVSQAMGRAFQYDASGFQTFPATYQLPSGSYKVGIQIQNGISQALVWSDETLVLP